MNKLVLIGNGFDLAHRLKTKYTDFLLWYLNNTIQNFHKFGEYEDQLVIISFKDFYIENLSIDCTSIDKFKLSLERYKTEIKFNIKSAFFKKLFNIITELNWVDIELEYYSYLKKLYIQSENNNFSNLKHVKSLNKNFEFIKDKLQEYLNTLKSSKINQIPDIVEHFKKHFSIVPNTQSFIMFLNFNYTTTIVNYLRD